MRSMRSKQRGVTLPELIFAIGIVLSLLALGAVAIKKGGLMYKTYNAATQVEAISQAAIAWAGADAKFTGISMTVLDTATLSSDIEAKDWLKENKIDVNPEIVRKALLEIKSTITDIE